MIVFSKKTIDESAQNYREVLSDGDSLRSCEIGKAEDGRPYTALVFIVPSDAAMEMMKRIEPVKQMIKSFGDLADSVPLTRLPPPMMVPQDKNALTNEELRELGLV